MGYRLVAGLRPGHRRRIHLRPVLRRLRPGAEPTQTVTSAGQLATINARYYTDGRSRVAYFGRGGFYPFQFGSGGVLLPLASPVARTEYVYGDPTARFDATLIAAPTDDDPFQGFVFDGDRAYPSGTTRSVDWLRGPLAAGIQAQTPGERFYFCSACRDATSMVLGFTPYVDTTPATAARSTCSTRTRSPARFRLYRNGTMIDDQVNYAGDFVTVPPGTATYRAVTTVHRSIGGFHTSTDTTEDVTFRSGATTGPTAPPGWFCPNEPPCTVLPILSATVPLPTDGYSRLPVGAHDGDLLGRLQPAGAHRHDRRRQLRDHDQRRVDVHALPVTSLGHGHYRVTLANAAAQRRARGRHPRQRRRLGRRQARRDRAQRLPRRALTVGHHPEETRCASACWSGTTAMALLGPRPAWPCRARRRRARAGFSARATPRTGGTPRATPSSAALARAQQRAAAADITQPSLTPADIAAAYKLPASASHATVAIVDAYDNPNAESDLADYRATYGLPACTTANGCFRKVEPARASTPLPDGDPGWGVEIALDLDAVSAACPTCTILLVEGDSEIIDDLGAAVNTAVRARRRRGQQQLRRGRVQRHAAATQSLLHPPRRRDRRLARATTASAPPTSPPCWPDVDRRRRHLADQDAKPARGWTEHGVGGRGQRLLGLRRQAGLAARHALPDAHGRRRLGGRRPGQRVRRLRHLRAGQRRRAASRSAAPASPRR